MWCSLVITWGFHPHNPSSNLGMDIPGLVAQSVERLVSSEQTGDRRSPGPICRGGWFRRPFSMGPEGVRFTSAALSAMPQRSGAPLRMECNSQAGSTPVVDNLESRDGGRHADSKSVAAKRLQVRFLLLSYSKPRGAMA